MSSTLYHSLEIEETLGKDIVLPKTSHEALFVAEYGEVFCYLGVCETDEKRRSLAASWPYHLQGKHISQHTDMALGMYRLVSGGIRLSPFVDHEIFAGRKFKHLANYFVRLPHPGSSYYGILSSSEHGECHEDELTRACFGLTYRELNELIDAYARILGLHTPYVQYPRITRSLRSSNYCEITGAWIPAGFPYITFSQSGYRYSHISLYGFYRHIGLLLRTGFAISEVFKNKHIPEGILESLRQINGFYLYEPLVTRPIVEPSWETGRLEIDWRRETQV